MSSQLVAAVASGMILMALGASAKAIIDVEVLKAENMNLKELVIEVRQDVKEIKTHMIK